MKLVYTEEAQALRFEVSSAQRLITYFGTVEIALGAWVVTAQVADLRARLALFVLNLIFALCVAILIRRNYRRRDDVVRALRGAVEALGLTAEGTYLPDRPIHDYRWDSSWQPIYYVLIGVVCLAQAVPLFLLAPEQGR